MAHIMSKSLAELRQSPRVGLPERTYSLCLASALVGEVQRLLNELEELAPGEEDGPRPPKRMGDGGRVQEIRESLRALSEEMREHTGDLLIRGVDGGQWRLWVDANPPREDNARDTQLAYGVCNADALIDALGTFAAAWNGDPLAEGDWAFIASKAAPGDLMEIASLVVKMHEMVVDVPKLLSRSPGIIGDATE